MIKELEMLGYNGQKLRAISNAASEAPDAIVLLVHGMQEHVDRYRWFAEKLENENVYFVGADLRGHGQNMLCGRPGLDNGDIYLNIVEDYKIFIEQLRAQYAQVPIILFGHSFGSFVSQRFVRDGNSELSKIILCGSSYMNTPIVKSARVIAAISKLFSGRSADADLIESLSIRSYGKKFENGNWLTRDGQIFADYSNDDGCGCVFPVAFYESMFSNLPKNYKNIQFDSEVLLISGDKDPVCDFSKGVKKLEKVYKKRGVKVSLKLYREARHELLNEINREEVFEDILSFIKK